MTKINSSEIIEEIKTRKDLLEGLSYARNSIPTAGSGVHSRNELNDSLKVNKVIRHKDGGLTIVTEHGYLRAWFRGWESYAYTTDNKYHVVVMFERDGNRVYNMIAPNENPSPTMGGYYNLESLLKLKNRSMRDLKHVRGEK